MVSINPADCGPDEAYVGTVYGKRYFMQRTDLSNDSRDHPWLAVRHDRAYPCSTDKEWVADEMVSDLTRLVPYDRGGVPGPTWAERERDEAVARAEAAERACETLGKVVDDQRRGIARIARPEHLVSERAERERDEREEKYLDADKALHDMRLERDGWRDRYRALQSEYARQSQAWSEQRAYYEKRMVPTGRAGVYDAEMEAEVRRRTECLRENLRGVEAARDEWEGKYWAAVSGKGESPDPVEELAGQIEAATRTAIRKVAARVLGQEDHHVDQ